MRKVHTKKTKLDCHYMLPFTERFPTFFSCLCEVEAVYVYVLLGECGFGHRVTTTLTREKEIKISHIFFLNSSITRFLYHAEAAVRHIS